MAEDGRVALAVGDAGAALGVEAVGHDADPVRVGIAARHLVGEHEPGPARRLGVMERVASLPAHVELEARPAGHHHRLAERHLRPDLLADAVGAAGGGRHERHREHHRRRAGVDRVAAEAACAVPRAIPDRPGRRAGRRRGVPHRHAVAARHRGGEGQRHPSALDDHRHDGDLPALGRRVGHGLRGLVGHHTGPGLRALDVQQIGRGGRLRRGGGDPHREGAGGRHRGPVQGLVIGEREQRPLHRRAGERGRRHVVIVGDRHRRRDHHHPRRRAADRQGLGRLGDGVIHRGQGERRRGDGRAGRNREGEGRHRREVLGPGRHPRHRELHHGGRGTRRAFQASGQGHHRRAGPLRHHPARRGGHREADPRHRVVVGDAAFREGLREGRVRRIAQGDGEGLALLVEVVVDEGHGEGALGDPGREGEGAARGQVVGGGGSRCRRRWRRRRSPRARSGRRGWPRTPAPRRLPPPRRPRPRARAGRRRRGWRASRAGP